MTITDRSTVSEVNKCIAEMNQHVSEKKTLDNVTIYRLGNGNKFDKYLYPVRAFLFSKKLHKKNNYNLVWAMLATWAGMAALLFKLFNPKIKYFLTLQSGDADWFLRIRTWFWFPVYHMVYTKADHIQVISHWLKKRARHYGYKKEISIVPNGVDLNKFQVQEKEKSNNQKIIFTSSRLVKKNNLASLIKAISLLDMPVSLLIAGSGRLESKLKELVKKLNLENKVIFLGQVERSEEHTSELQSH